MENRWHGYPAARSQALRQEFGEQAATVYCMGRGEGRDARLVFIFNNAEALKRVRWRRFSDDCWALAGDSFDPVEAHLDRERESAVAFLADAYADIMRHFDPKVVRLQRKNQVILSPQAMESLDRLMDDDHTP